jgi:hypothetical protein
MRAVRRLLLAPRAGPHAGGDKDAGIEVCEDGRRVDGAGERTQPWQSSLAAPGWQSSGSDVDSGHRRDPARADCTRDGGYGRTGQYDQVMTFSDAGNDPQAVVIVNGNAGTSYLAVDG